MTQNWKKMQNHHFDAQNVPLQAMFYLCAGNHKKTILGSLRENLVINEYLVLKNFALLVFELNRVAWHEHPIKQKC